MLVPGRVLVAKTRSCKTALVTFSPSQVEAQKKKDEGTIQVSPDCWNPSVDSSCVHTARPSAHH